MAEKKCRRCGCFQDAIGTLKASAMIGGSLETLLGEAQDVFEPKRYDCLGCEVCWPATAQNLATEADPAIAAGSHCATAEPEPRAGWPPLAGDYQVLRYQAPVAVCTLNSNDLVRQLAAARPPGLAIVGGLHTENLGIERLIRNLLPNLHVRFLVMCGADSRQAIGHLPGQSLVALARNGLDERHRIIGAKGKRPVLRNLDEAAIEHFRRTREVIDLVGESNLDSILSVVGNCAARDPGMAAPLADCHTVEPVCGSVPTRMVSDPAGYFVIFPDRTRGVLALEHYANNGVLTAIVEGHTAAELYMTAIERNLISRLDHAAYLGRELARAEQALSSAQPYVQDAAPETASALHCGCTSPCSVNG